MIKLIHDPVIYSSETGKMRYAKPGEEAKRRNTIAYSILRSHDISGKEDSLSIRFDAMASHDITYVGIIQTALASGMKRFPVPYVLTCCHNSLCAVGGTINEDDHIFGLSAAKKYGGIFVPPHMAVIHSYMRENFAGCGKMILGSDSHTRYGAIGTMGIGEGGPEIVKQLLERTYDISMPKTVLIYLKGSPKEYIGPHDVALALVGATFPDSFAKNTIFEFAGEGIGNLSMEFRNGIDVMTTETSCLSSIWETDEKTKEYLEKHCRGNEYRRLKTNGEAYYDAAVEIDLGSIEPMIALPFHPSNVYTIKEFKKNATDILRAVEKEAKESLGMDLKLTDKVEIDGRIRADQGVIAGCAGGIYDNIIAAADILLTKKGYDSFPLSIYPSSMPCFSDLLKKGYISTLTDAGAVVRSAFCGPCFGAGDVPSNSSLSIRHTTRNFPNREGSKPGEGQSAAVALMDARSIAATAVNGGYITGADEIEASYSKPEYIYDPSSYEKRVYSGYGKADPEAELVMGPNIRPWPEMEKLGRNVLLRIASAIYDPVTTTDELIPSGETSSFRSNPERLSEFALSRKDPGYVKRAKDIREAETERLLGRKNASLAEIFDILGCAGYHPTLDETETGSAIFAKKPGDGSAREQAASCQRVLGGLANISLEYATKRYRSNLINWGMLPLYVKEDIPFAIGDSIYLENISEKIASGECEFEGIYIHENEVGKIKICIDPLTDEEKKIISAGCLINYYRDGE